MGSCVAGGQKCNIARPDLLCSKRLDLIGGKTRNSPCLFPSNLNIELFLKTLSNPFVTCRTKESNAIKEHGGRFGGFGFLNS